MPKISVIIPIYGVEKYIERCARSLFEQTLDDIEYLFIDDCTPDHSIDILEQVLEEYPKRKSQVIIHRMEHNSGQAKVREWGMRNASGLYVIHCDSDDWVDLNIYKIMYDTAKKENLDVVCCDCKNTDGTQYTITSAGSNLNVEECIYEMMHRKMWWSLCNKIFKRTLYAEDFIYPKDAMGEDMCMCLQMMKKAKSIGYVKNIYYYYYTNPKSIVNVWTPEQCLNKYGQLTRNLNILKDSYRDLLIKKEIKKGFVYLEFYAQEMLMPAVHKSKEIYKVWRMGLKGLCIPVMMDTMVPSKQRIKAMLISLHLFPL